MNKKRGAETRRYTTPHKTNRFLNKNKLGRSFLVTIILYVFFGICKRFLVLASINGVKMTIITTDIKINSTKCVFSTTLSIPQGSETKLQGANNINTSYCQPANLIPHFWYYKIVDKDGSPDLPCIQILSELFGWFRSLSKSNTYYSTGNSLPELVDGKLAVSYDFLSDKLNFQKERIRKKLVRLESLGILARDVRNIALDDGSRINQLYISIDRKFFDSCFRDPELDIRVRTDEADIMQSPDFKTSPLFGGEHICNKNKNRYLQSDFIFSDLKEKKADAIENRVGDSQIINSVENLFAKKVSEVKQDSALIFHTRRKPKQLGDFYPLTQEDCSTLQLSSGRDFSLNAMNEILADMSKRLSDRVFFDKKSFLSYMTKVFQYEMRDSVKISNENFKIKSNQTEEEKVREKQEEYLAEIENSLQVSPEWHLKKKLVCVLKPEKAYQLLKSCKRMEASGEGGIFQIHLKRYVELSQLEKEIILNQVKATHEKLENGEYKAIEAVEFVQPEKARSNDLKTTTAKNSKLPEGIWGKIRSVLIEYNGSSGQAIDSHWISKLDAEIDEREKRIKLRAPSDLIKDWIQSNYQQTIDLLVRNSGFELESLSC